MKTTCPQCGQQAVTPVRKLFAGPVQTLTCPHCGTHVGVPVVQAFVALAPFFVALILSITGVVGSGVGVLLWVAGIVLACVLYLWWVPLERRA